MEDPISWSLEELNHALARSPEANSAWSKLPPSHQREHLAYISEAKKPETRARRIEKTIHALIQKR